MFSWNIIGHKPITDFLEKSITHGKISHAYLFYGGQQLGKKTLAKKFVQALLCYKHNPHTKTIPCGACPHCQQIIKNNHPDIFWLKKETDKKEISVEQIRELQNNMSLHSFFKSYKIGLIEEAEYLNASSANAFLKTLEEPKKQTILILLANNLKNIPATIASRTQKIKLLPVPAKEIYNFLIQSNQSREEAKILAHLANGKPGRALTFLRAPELSQSYLSQLKIFFSLTNNSRINKFKYLDKLLSNKENLTDKIRLLTPILNIWQLLFRDVILFKLSQNDKIINITEINSIAKISQKYSLKQLILLENSINQTKFNLSLNGNPKLTMENLLLKF